MEEKQTFVTGAVRNSAIGRGAYELLPARAIHLLAKHFEDGAAAHGDRNWEKGMNLSRILQSALRHSFQYLETGESVHAVSSFWNWSILLETSERIKSGLLPKELDDLSNLPSWQKPKKSWSEASDHIYKELEEFNKQQEARNKEEDLPDWNKNARWDELQEIFYPELNQESNQDIPNEEAQKELLAWVDEEFQPKTLDEAFAGSSTGVEACGETKDFYRWREVSKEMPVISQSIEDYVLVTNNPVFEMSDEYICAVESKIISGNIREYFYWKYVK